MSIGRDLGSPRLHRKADVPPRQAFPKSARSDPASSSVIRFGCGQVRTPDDRPTLSVVMNKQATPSIAYLVTSEIRSCKARLPLAIATLIFLNLLPRFAFKLFRLVMVLIFAASGDLETEIAVPFLTDHLK